MTKPAPRIATISSRDAARRDAGLAPARPVGATGALVVGFLLVLLWWTLVVAVAVVASIEPTAKDSDTEAFVGFLLIGGIFVGVAAMLWLADGVTDVVKAATRR